ncbi:MAG: hypothetical protein HY900_09090 [Deltaproteobacteria bacterium]|nr:hypothetical protein [Deltaproteobacteria bacterium]
MDIILGRTYRIVIRFPWGARFEARTDCLVRDPGGGLRWSVDEEHWPGATGIDLLLQETDHWILGWVEGYGNVPAVVSDGGDAPEP